MDHLKTRVRFAPISGAGKHRQPGIFLEAVVGQSHLAEKKDRPSIGFNALGMDAVPAEAGPRLNLRRFQRRFHTFRITAGFGLRPAPARPPLTDSIGTGLPQDGPHDALAWRGASLGQTSSSARFCMANSI